MSEISIKTIAKQSAKFNLASVVSFLVKLPTQLIIGIFLLPEQYGIISFVALWSLYGSLINPGTTLAGRREVPYLLGKNKKAEAREVQNIAISADLLWSILPFVVILIAAFFYPGKTIKLALILGAVSFLVGRFVGYWSSFNTARQNFTVSAIAKLIGAIAVPVFTLAAIYWLKIYAVLLAPIFGSAVTWLYYLKKGPIGYSFNLDWEKIKKLAKVGVVFSLAGIVFYAHRMADRTVIAAYLSLRDLGLFTFAMGFIVFAIRFLSDFGTVLEPMLWKESGSKKSSLNVFWVVKRVSIYTALLTAMAIPFLQVFYTLLVPLLTPNYIDSVAVFTVLSLFLYLVAMAIPAGTVLSSLVVNKQRQRTLIYTLGLVLSVALDLYLVYLGYGIIAIALATLVAQAVITFSIFWLSRTYITKSNKEFVVLLGKVLLPLAVAVGFTIFNYYNWFKASWAPQSVISLVMQFVVWTIIVFAFYRKYFPKKQLAEIWKFGRTLLHRKIKK